MCPFALFLLSFYVSLKPVVRFFINCKGFLYFAVNQAI